MRWFVSLLVPALAFAAPVPKAKDALPPFATTEGDTLEYEYSTRGKPHAWYTERVTGAEKQKDGSAHVTIRTAVTGGETFSTTFAVSGTVLSTVAKGQDQLTKPSRVLKLPLAVGAKWEELNEKYEVTAEEEVEVPAGKFKAVKVEKTTSEGTWRTWYAPGVGIVKMTATVTETVLELKAFKPGK